jgi:hypothetical protein
MKLQANIAHEITIYMLMFQLMRDRDGYLSEHCSLRETQILGLRHWGAARGEATALAFSNVE